MKEIDMARQHGHNMEVEFIDNKDAFNIGYKSFLAGLKAGIGKLRYCCTCKKWKECKVVSMYGICADWVIKEIKEND